MYKLQICCFIILCFIIGIYLSVKRKHSYEHNVFVTLLFWACANLCLDMTTVYTVTNLEKIPTLVNRILHMLFYISIIGAFYIVFLYILAMFQEKGDTWWRKCRWMKYPPILPIAVMCVLPIEYVESPNGNYSWGPACAALYLMMAYYTILSMILLMRYRNDLNRKKKKIITMALGIEVSVSIYQAFMPYSLVSGFGITVLCMALFLTVENPDVQLLENLKEEKKKAERANSAKSVFLASMSHEIRTPINGVLGMNEMILRESSEENVREYAMNVKSAAQLLLSLVSDILDLTKLESGKVEIQPVEYEVSTLLGDVYNLIRDRAERKGLQLQMHVDGALPAVLLGDDVRIRQVLMNLLTNAVKYTESGSVALIVSGKQHKEEIKLNIEVRDTGIGIKASDIQRLFLKFERLDEIRNRKIEGTGLGLTITQQLLEKMGSRLNVESEYGVGSVFSFELKQGIVDATEIGDFQKRVKEKSQGYAYESELYAPEAKILLVDDNDLNRKVFVALLKETGVQVREANCGRACLECVQEERFDIIFLDHMMPDMDGIETLRRMRELEENKCKETPVIAFTANAVSGVKEAYKKEGFASVLFKPVAPEKLERMLIKRLPKELLLEAKPRKSKKQEKKDEAEQLAYVDGMDWKYAGLYLPEADLLQKLVVNFYGSIDKTVAEIRELADGIESEEGLRLYQTRVHGLKSVAAMVGALQISGLAKLLEYAAKEEKREKVRLLTPVLLEELAVQKERLTVLMPKEERHEKLEDPSHILAMLEMLRTALWEMDIDAADAAMKELKRHVYDDELQKEIEQLSGLVDALQMEEAGKIAERLLDILQKEE